MQGLLEIDALIDGMIDAGLRNFDCSFVSINEISTEAERVVAVVQPDLPKSLFAVFGKYAHQNPLLARYLETRDGRAYQFTDVISKRDLHALELYQQVYKKINVEQQLAFMLQAPPRSVLAFVLSKDGKPFTEAERELANRARPFLIQAWSNAIKHTALRDALAAQVTGASEADSWLIAELQSRGITGRQAQVLLLTARGRSNRATGELLGISERTVQKHLERCYRELGVRDRSAASELVWSLVGEYPERAARSRRGLHQHQPS